MAAASPPMLAGVGLNNSTMDQAIDTGDTAWMLTATALVVFMTVPGENFSPARRSHACFAFYSYASSSLIFPPTLRPQESLCSSGDRFAPRIS